MGPISAMANLVHLTRELRKAPILTFIRRPKLGNQLKTAVFRLRWLIPLALVCWYILHKFAGRSIDFTPLFSNLAFWNSLAIFLLYLVGTEVLYMKLSRGSKPGENRTQLEEHKWRNFARWVGAGEALFICWFYIMTQNPRSDIPLLLFIPLVWTSMYLYMRGNLFFLVAGSALLLLSTVVTVILSPGIRSGFDIILVFGAKAVIFVVVALYVIWLQYSIRILGNFKQALYDNSPDGVSLIGQRGEQRQQTGVDMQILAMNTSQKELTPSASVLEQSCWKVFGKQEVDDSSKPCSRCPAVDVLGGKVTIGRDITGVLSPLQSTSPDTIHLDVSVSPLRDENHKVIAAVKVAKDVTGQVLSFELSSALSEANTVDDVLTIAAAHIRAMYRAKKVRLLSMEKRGEQGILTPEAEGSPAQPMGVRLSADLISPCSSILVEELTDSYAARGWQNFVFSKRLPSHELRRLFDITNGVIAGIPFPDSLWGFVVVDLDKRDESPVDVLLLFNATKCISAALQRVRANQHQDRERVSERTELMQERVVFRDFQQLLPDMAKCGNADHIMGLN